MFNLCSRITIGGKTFSGLFEVNVKRSIYSLSATATVRIPSRATVREAGKPMRYVDTYDEVGFMNRVVIELGYNEQYNTEFTGYVVNVGASSSFTEIECQDIFCTTRARIVSIDDLSNPAELALRCGLVPEMVLGIDISGFKANREPVSAILSRLKDEYECCVYFGTNEKVNICTAKRLVGENRRYRLGWNTVQDNGLAFKSGDAEQTKYNISYMGKDGNPVEFSVGSGEKVKNVPLYDLKNILKIKDFAETLTDNVLGTGMAGQFTAFLMPFTEPADRIAFLDREGNPFPGVSLVESTEVTFGRGGARRIIDVNTYNS